VALLISEAASAAVVLMVLLVQLCFLSPQHQFSLPSRVGSKQALSYPPLLFSSSLLHQQSRLALSICGFFQFT
jgi:hypothetical protein